MTGSVDERAVNTGQTCRKGAIRGNITALGEAYGEYRCRFRQQKKKGELC